MCMQKSEESIQSWLWVFFKLDCRQSKKVESRNNTNSKSYLTSSRWFFILKMSTKIVKPHTATAKIFNEPGILSDFKIVRHHLIKLLRPFLGMISKIELDSIFLALVTSFSIHETWILLPSIARIFPFCEVSGNKNKMSKSWNILYLKMLEKKDKKIQTLKILKNEKILVDTQN